MAKIQVTPIIPSIVTFGIIGTTPLIQHAWSQKALGQLRMTAAERRKQVKTKKDPETEAVNCIHYTDAGAYGIPARAIKACLTTAAHKDTGLTRTLVMKSLFIPDPDKSGNIPMECSEPWVREDIVKVGQNQTDLRYRPQFDNWKCIITAEMDSSALSPEDLAQLVTRAGFGIGLLEWRPQKGGDNGRFQLDPNVPMKIEEK